MAVDFRKFSEQLSGEGISLSPNYERALVPSTLETDDRVYDPALDTFSHSPEVIGTIQNKNLFSSALSKGLEIIVPIKPANSDAYTIPVELRDEIEFIQKVIDHEHRATHSAHTRKAFLLASHPHKDIAGWHFDVKEKTKFPVRTYCCSDQDPTRYAKIRFNPEAVPFSYKKGNAFEFMLAASGFQRGDQNISSISEWTVQPYEISRHNAITPHRGYSGDHRTLLSITYFEG